MTEQAGGQQRAVKLLLAGTATANYAKANDGDNTYSVSLSPHLLWSFYERIMFESHVDVRASDSGNSLNLEFAAAWVVVSDHVVVGAGKLLAPFGFYTEAIHTAWLNRLPDEPLPVADHTGLTPTHLIGVEARGVLELDPGVITAAVYGGSSGVLDMTTEGTLRGGLVDFDHFEHVAGGGRVTYRPYPSLEIGVSSQLGRVDPSDPPGDIAAPGRVMSWIGGADASVSRVVDFLSGTIDAKAELVVSELRQRDGTAFDRARRGLYLQTSYSPTQVDAKWLRGFEAVVRYDRLGPSEMIPSVDRFATGLDYWFTASIVAKLAGELSVTDSAPPHRYTVLGQVAVGF